MDIVMTSTGVKITVYICGCTLQNNGYLKLIDLYDTTYSRVEGIPGEIGYDTVSSVPYTSTAFNGTRWTPLRVGHRYRATMYGWSGNEVDYQDFTFVLPQPNITATNMILTPSKSPCIEGDCTVNVSVTWQNQGNGDGSFVPSLVVNGTPITAQYPSEVLSAGTSVTHTFPLTNMIKGQYSICPSPN